MATALVESLRAVGSPLFPGGCAYACTVAFWGLDVPDGQRGQHLDVMVQLSDGYTLGDLKAALAAAVTNKATELGLALNAADIDVPGFEHAPPP